MDERQSSEPNATALTRRLTGFVAHLRLNDFPIGPAETAATMDALTLVDPLDVGQARLGLKTLLAGRQEEWERFDDLFEAYWLRRGRTRNKAATATSPRASEKTPKLWEGHLPDAERKEAAGPAERTGHDGDDERDGTGRLIASRQTSLMKADLRHIAEPEELAEAERCAANLAKAMRYRLSRRYRMASKGPRIDLRRTARRNIPHGGDPIELVRRKRPDKPVRIVVLLDVSGSMKQYSRFFLQFVKGLVSTWVETDAYLFHTRLVRVTEAMRDTDPIKAMSRLALMTQGFGGGTEIARSLRHFNDRYAKAALNSRSVVMILSDGYDTGDPSGVAREMKRLRRKARRIVWLNPLLGWRDYQPVAQAMAEALPHVDCFAAAHSLEALAKMEGEFARL